jgi:hypothetical protein
MNTCYNVQNNCHNLTIFNTYLSFMHHGGNLDKNNSKKFCSRYDSCPNLELCCEINTHMNDIIVQKKLFWFVKPWNIYTIPIKGLNNTTFNDNLFMKFYTYKK